MKQYKTKAIFSDSKYFQSQVIEDKALYKIHESGILVKMMSARNTTKN